MDKIHILYTNGTVFYPKILNLFCIDGWTFTLVEFKNRIYYAF
jgi:hypothetical protein